MKVIQLAKSEFSIGTEVTVPESFTVSITLPLFVTMLQSMAKSLLKGLKSLEKMHHLNSPLTFQVLLITRI